MSCATTSMSMPGMGHGWTNKEVLRQSTGPFADRIKFGLHANCKAGNSADGFLQYRFPCRGLMLVLAPRQYLVARNIVATVR